MTAGDRLDLDELDRFDKSRAGELYKAKLREMIAAELRTLEDRSKAAEDLRAAQGAAAALRRVLALPAILEAEIKEKLKGK